jgi:hypothetical protein
VKGRKTGADIVDPLDPAFGEIVAAALELSRFGYSPNDPDVARRAIIVGGRRWKEKEDERRAACERVASLQPHEGAELVYYMRIGNRVKIGTTGNLKSRLSTINPEELMATEPGGRERERARHDQFKELRTHGEWFRLEEPLVSYMEKLKKLSENPENA